MGNQQESGTKRYQTEKGCPACVGTEGRYDSGQAMVRRRPAIRTRLEGQTFPPGFSKLWERRYLALWPDRGTNRSKAIEAPERVSRGGENRLEGSA
jgi:hypothetical protein